MGRPPSAVGSGADDLSAGGHVAEAAATVGGEHDDEADQVAEQAVDDAQQGADQGGSGAGAALIRTLLRIIDGLFAYLVGFILVLASDRRRRLGDIAARTLVVRA